jgi:hypothetical protein
MPAAPFRIYRVRYSRDKQDETGLAPPFVKYQELRLTLWRLTWSARATAARNSPARNGLAACLRRFSKAWKRRRDAEVFSYVHSIRDTRDFTIFCEIQ